MTKGTYLCDISDSALYHGECSLFVWRKPQEGVAEATRACGGSHQSVWRKPPERMAEATLSCGFRRRRSIISNKNGCSAKALQPNIIILFYSNMITQEERLLRWGKQKRKYRTLCRDRG